MTVENNQPKNKTGLFPSRHGTGDMENEKPQKASMLSKWFGTWEDWEKPRSKIVLAIAFSIVLSMILLPRLQSGEMIQQLEVGQIAPYDVRAPSDMQVKDPDTTALKRQEAEASIRPVYVYRPDVQEEIHNQIDLAFSTLRTDIATWIRNNNVKLPVENNNEEPAPSPSAKTNGNNQNADEPEKKEIEITMEPPPPVEEIIPNLSLYLAEIKKSPATAKTFSENLASFSDRFIRNLQADITQKEFNRIVEDNLSSKYQEELKRISGILLGHRLVRNLNLVKTGDDDRVSIQDSGPETAPRLMRLDRTFLDLNAVRTDLWRIVSAPTGWTKEDLRLLENIVARIIKPNTTYDERITEKFRHDARDQVDEAIIPVKKGEVIVRNGEPITQKHYMIFQAMEQELSFWSIGSTFLGNTLAIFITFLLVYMFGKTNVSKFDGTSKNLVMMSLLLVGSTFFVRVVAYLGGMVEHAAALPDGFYYYLIPVAVAPAVVRIIVNSETSLLYLVIWTMLFSRMTSEPSFLSLYCLFGGLVGSHAFAKMRDRKVVLFASLYVMLVGFAVVMLSQLVEGKWSSMELGSLLVVVLVSALAMGPLILLITTVLEYLFDYTTDLGLLELANLNHPALKQLIVQAPGTYHHSIVVGTMAEAAAESIRANPLLARVGAYFHDIGKAKNPQYFAENQGTGRNPHDKISPHMSARIIASHVRHGVELAHEHKLGRQITDLITQHHGDSLMQFFYVKAQNLAEIDPKKTEVNKHEFRYPGPRPQSREAALIMIADACEAASRSLQEPTQERIQGLVHKIINKLFRDGQFDECDLTLRDLHNIARSFTRTLSTMHHHRPSYPEMKREGAGEASQTAGTKKSAEDSSEVNANGSSRVEQAEKSAADSSEVDLDDDEDLKRLGMR